jgi:hypothetical protein
MNQVDQMSIDDLLIATIIGGVGLAGFYLRAEYALHRGFKAAKNKNLIVLHELHAVSVGPRQIDVSPTTIPIHQDFFENKSRVGAESTEADFPSAIYPREPKSVVAIVRHSELAPCQKTLFVKAGSLSQMSCAI